MKTTKIKTSNGVQHKNSITMKQILLILIVIGILTSCQSQRDKQQQAIDNRIDNELATGLRNDTIFLGLRFGMTEKETSAHLNKLVSEKKIYLNTSSAYEYEFDFGENSMLSKGQATFSADYFNDKLFKLSISVKSSDDLISDAEYIQVKLMEIYASKYGYTCLTKKSILDDSDIYIWINGNRMIKLVAGINDARIFYIDLIAEQEKEEFDDNETIEKKETIKNDI